MIFDFFDIFLGFGAASWLLCESIAFTYLRNNRFWLLRTILLAFLNIYIRIIKQLGETIILIPHMPTSKPHDNLGGGGGYAV